MTAFGYTLSSEEHPPRQLVQLARRAEEVGFDFLTIAAAATAQLFQGRFFLGVGTGEALNEHVAV